ncbi:hypothetical protein Plo01_18720 [Planobispora longispora]|uniref:Uncharacterized protein n=1 Tax=Planobispora longispora TaxID=28887 RepID=A0A8J3RIB2_9ACTN|nr:hypothetical protein Plo01_18720 [Planobispora longispora]
MIRPRKPPRHPRHPSRITEIRSPEGRDGHRSTTAISDDRRVRNPEKILRRPPVTARFPRITRSLRPGVPAGASHTAEVARHTRSHGAPEPRGTSERNIRRSPP